MNILLSDITYIHRLNNSSIRVLNAHIEYLNNTDLSEKRKGIFQLHYVLTMKILNESGK